MIQDEIDKIKRAPNVNRFSPKQTSLFVESLIRIMDVAEIEYDDRELIIILQNGLRLVHAKELGELLELTNYLRAQEFSISINDRNQIRIRIWWD